MGYMKHHAIVITSWKKGLIESAREEAMKLFDPRQVSEVTPETVNGYRSLLIAPDGSKEGWAESDRGNMARDVFVGWIKEQTYEDGSNPFDWVEVMYGDDDTLACGVVRDGDEDRRAADGMDRFSNVRT